MTKKNRPVIVPLSQQAAAILASSREVSNSSEWVFPSRSKTGRHMTNMSINRALQDLGIDTRKEHTGHSWRSTAKTMINERIKKFDPEVVDFQLAHYSDDPLGYDRLQYSDERIEMMQAWGDYLDGLKATKD